ncbi:Aste57867_9802 [Aphanomyces stellatus]|uniref:Aste57867_9802 protein n=1 Tax=Aphanomyces stellatus TaxID=120398 RepID=A0A485KNU4_9STRA|nr:hypothetical protein As57867_009763 [Aphanomyces stellatus]VFT86681.1 Aste57867_9802 [Aphanomyces stellatus]
MVELPALSSTAAAPFLDLNSKTSEIDINLLLNGTSSLLVGMNVTTDQSNVKANGAYIGSQGLSITSNSGEINVTTLFVNATGPVGAKAPTTLTSSLGSVSLNNASLLDSPLTVSTDVSGIMLNNVITSVTHGRSNVALSSISGGIVASALSADWVSMKTKSGAITTDGLMSNGNDAFLGRIDVQSIGGDVRLLKTIAKGYVHVETNSGNIVVHLTSSTFVGLFYVRSEFGRISVRNGGNSTFDTITPLPTTDPREQQGLINCDTSCHYVGDIYVRTIYGNIDVLVGCQDPNACP